jgi:hypothetical protein
MTIEIKRRIAEGHIVIVTDAPTKSADGDAREYRLLTGEDARAHMAEPAGPVTRVVYEPATAEEDREYQLEVQEVKDPSDRFIAAEEQKAKDAEAAHQAIGKKQAAAEKKAAKEAPKPVVQEDPADEASAEWRAAQEAEFMEREKARQKAAKELDLVAKLNASSDDDDKPEAKPAAKPAPKK